MQDLIGNAQQLIDVFGRWPAFHDGEVVRITLDRSGPDAPSLEARIHVFEATGDVDGTRYFILRKHTLVTLRFADIELEELCGFNHQNVLFDLEVSTIDPQANEGRRLQVTLSTSCGVSAVFRCRSASVVEALPFSGERAEAR
jgi:Immunity protein 50